MSLMPHIFCSRMSYGNSYILLLAFLKYVNGYAEISANPGAYFEDIKNIHVYERTSPVIYTINLSLQTDLEEIRRKLTSADEENNPIAPSEEKERMTVLLQNLMDLKFMNDAILSEFELKREETRAKRGLQFIGSALTWCCNVMTVRDGRDILSNQMSLKEAYDKARSILLDSHAELLNVSTDLHNFAAASSRQIQNLHEDIASTRDRMVIQERYILNKERMRLVYESLLTIFSTASVLNSKLSHLFLSCKSNHIPGTVISRKAFQKDLERVKRAANLNNMELAIELKDINLYYHAKLVTCTTSGSSVEIEIKVPLRKKGAEYSLHRYVPIMFKSHDEKLCGWEQEPAVIVYEAKSRAVRIASGTELELCNTHDPICHVPQGRGTSNKAACAAALFLEKPYNELIKSCALKCEDNHGATIVKQIGDEKFAITNARSTIEITNTANGSTSLASVQEQWPGMAIMKVPCEFQIRQQMNGGLWDILVPAGMPCVKNEDPQIEIIHHLPIVWALIGDIEIRGGFEQSFHFRNMTTAYDKEWADKVPYFTTVTPTKEIEKRLSNVEIKIPQMDGSDYFNLIHLLLICWCSLLTLAIVVIVFVWVCNSVKAVSGEKGIFDTIAAVATEMI